MKRKKSSSILAQWCNEDDQAALGFLTSTDADVLSHRDKVKKAHWVSAHLVTVWLAFRSMCITQLCHIYTHNSCIITHISAVCLLTSFSSLVSSQTFKTLISLEQLSLLGRRTFFFFLRFFHFSKFWHQPQKIKTNKKNLFVISHVNLIGPRDLELPPHWRGLRSTAQSPRR